MLLRAGLFLNHFKCLLQILSNCIFILLTKIFCKPKNTQQQVVSSFIYRKFTIKCHFKKFSLGLSPNPNNQIIKLSNKLNKLIPEATDREPISLIFVVPAYKVIVVIQVAVPGSDWTALRRTPPVTEGINAEEWSIAPVVAARKT